MRLEGIEDWRFTLARPALPGFQVVVGAGIEPESHREETEQT